MFSWLFGSNNNTSDIHLIASKYKANQTRYHFPTVGLTQGEKYNMYQSKLAKIAKERVKTPIEHDVQVGVFGSTLKEGFGSGNLEMKTNQIIRDNTYSPQQETAVSDLQQQYKDTLKEYETLLSQVNGTTNSYLSRVNPNNPYLGKNISIGGNLMYVTKQGVAKWYPSMDVFNSTVGANGCPSGNQASIVTVNLAWDNAYQTAGATIPTTPKLITGSPMVAGQSCGHEGTNVFVNSLMDKIKSTYEGCFASNPENNNMTFIGGTPPTNTTVIIVNGNFSQPALSTNTYQYLSGDGVVPGWYFNAVIANASSAWGFPTPYPNGPQCAVIQKTNYMSQIVNLQANVQYTLTFMACGRNCCDDSGQSNPVNIQLYTTSNQFISTVYTFQPPINQWTNYTATFTPQTSGNTQIFFSGTWSSSDRSTAVQNIQISSSANTGSSTGSYTYKECENAAVSAGYQYFALQNVNPQTSTGYCAVSNSQPASTQFGQSTVPKKQVALWSSNTANNSGATATLTNTGALSVINSTGTSIYNSPNTNAQPSNYLGCYGDSSTRAMTTAWTNGSQQYSNSQCQQIAQQNGFQYYGLQNSTSGTTAQCFLSNDLAQTTEYGAAGNCTQISDGSWSGGGWSNAVYNATLPNSSYYLILQDDGNMVVYRGTGPNDNQGVIWSTATNGKTQEANPQYVASNGKYAQNYIVSGATLAPGDFVGSTNGNMALIMQADGNLVLYTFEMTTNCQKMADGHMGGGVGANALYNIGQTAYPDNVSQVAYVDQNAEMHPYSSTNVQPGNKYTLVASNFNIADNNISNAAYGNATLQSCQQTCNSLADCAGIVMSGNYCYPKSSGFYPSSSMSQSTGTNIYLRENVPIHTPIGVPNTTANIDSVTYQNYVNGGAMSNEYGLANATSTQLQQLRQMETRLNLLTNQLNELTGTFSEGSNQAEQQSIQNVTGLGNYLKSMETTTSKIKGFNTNVENMLSDSDIVVLQQNYSYLFWSILATGTVLVSMNIAKNG